MIYNLNAKDTDFAGAKTMVFIDYEYWFLGMKKQHNSVPDIRSWFTDVKVKGQIVETLFFGDFTQSELKGEVERIRASLSSNIVDGRKSNNQKDHSDFIMLNNIYQKLIKLPDIEQFILFTGDGHFQSSVTFLRNFMDKIVGIYATEGSLNSQLAEAANWYVEMVPEEADMVAAANRAAVNSMTMNQMAVGMTPNQAVTYQTNRHRNILLSEPRNPIPAPTPWWDVKRFEIKKMIIGNLRWARENDRMPSFKRTVEVVCKNNFNVTEFEVKSVLSDMVKKGFIRQVTVDTANGNQLMTLEVDWDSIESYS
ncbi:MAG: NYN domain-containing protein [Defluviitaleaceae bacterium]|nr:NYN domain-containing protein [Defluviitaleaceae bacterium]